jgi:hypothetical protein
VWPKSFVEGQSLRRALQVNGGVEQAVGGSPLVERASGSKLGGLALVGVAVALVLPWKVSRCGGYISRELEEHPSTWPLRLLVTTAVLVPGWLAINRIHALDNENNPLWYRLLCLLALGVAWTGLIALLIWLDRFMP